MFEKLKDWLNLADYDRAKDEADLNIVARYSRGNLSLKDGAYMDGGELRRLSADGDAAIARIIKKTRAA